MRLHRARDQPETPLAELVEVRQGMILGLKQSRIETAHKMKEEGLDRAIIAKITGLSQEEIDKA